MGLKRSTSSISKCAGFFDKLSWLNIDETEWKQKAVLFKPDFIVHTAWTGVTSNARNDWEPKFKILIYYTLFFK